MVRPRDQVAAPANHELKVPRRGWANPLRNPRVATPPLFLAGAFLGRSVQVLGQVRSFVPAPEAFLGVLPGWQDAASHHGFYGMPECQLKAGRDRFL